MSKQTFHTLPVSDSTSMQVYTAVPEGKGPFPGMLVFQEAFGVNHYIRDIAQRFADLGYIAIAPELFHRSAPAGFEAAYTDFPSVAPHLKALSVEGLEADIRSANEWLITHPQIIPGTISCIGFCMGGRAAFIANTILPLKAAISFYGGGIVPDLIKKAASLHAPHLFFWGGLDKHILPEHVEAVAAALKESGKTFTNVVISDADHGFFCNERAAYNAAASRQAWALTKAFLEN